MKKIVYYVAISLDGYIAGKDGDISGFAYEGSGVKKYLEDLQAYKTVIMGRNTYEFGFQFGLKPGQLAYPHMDHYIFSNSLQLDDPDDKLKICPLDIEIVKRIKRQAQTDIYLCGGGVFASWLLKNNMIDTIKIKLNPFIVGGGIRLFEGKSDQIKLELVDTVEYDGGLQIMTYDVIT